MRINKHIIHYSLFIILFLAAILRLFRLGSIPPGLTPDEASLGYNAYSMLKTGRDEYGQFLPVIFKSFGDYKPGLYVYITVPSVALFGLMEFAVRLPSAIAGVVAVWLLYKVVLLLFGKQKHQSPNTNYESLASMASLLLAISPWHILFSRGAWEANLSLTLTLAGMLYFLKSIKNSKFLLLSSIFFSLTILSYQGAKLSTAIVLVVLTIVYWNECKRLIKNNAKIVLSSTIIGLIIISPIIFSFFQGKAGRLEVFSIFSYRRPEEQIQNIMFQGGETSSSISYLLFHSEGLNTKRAIIGRWFNHFSTRFLIFAGDWQNLRHSIPNHGMLLLSDLVFLSIGFVYLIRHKGKPAALLFLWLILSPLPAALSRDEVHAVRALNMVIPLTLISSVGAFTLIKYVSKLNRLRVTGYGLFFTFYLLPFTLFLDSYFVHLPIHNARYWFYGYKQVVQELAKDKDKYKNIVFQQSYDQPYIYFLFYQKYDPATYQKQAKLKEEGPDVGLVEKLNNVSFESFSWPYITDKNNTFIVGNSVAIPADLDKNSYRLIKEIRYPNGFETAFRIVEVR